MAWRAWIILGLLLAVSARAGAAPAITLPADQSSLSILPLTEMADGALPVATVLSGHAAFEPFRPGALRGWPVDIWLRVRIGPVPAGSRWFLRLSVVDRADAYIPHDNGRYAHQVGGVDVPFARRSVPYTLPTFTLMPSDASADPVYLHLRFHPEQRLSLKLENAFQRSRASVLRRFMQGVFLGVLLAVLLFNIYVFGTQRAYTAFWYIGFILALALNEIVATGIGAEYLWPDAGGDARLAVLFTSSLGYATYLQFARAFLRIRRSMPAMDTLVVALFVLQTLIAIAQYALPVGRALVAPLLAVQSITIFGMAFIGIARWRGGFEPARFFVIAFIPMAIGVIANLAYDAFLPAGNWFLAANGVEIGAMLQCIIMSFSVLDRIQILDRERHAAESALSTQALRNTELRMIALTDPLTGIANRLAFYDEVQVSIDRARDEGTAVGVLFIDVDGFKGVNDAYGHSTGDELLRIIARRLAMVVRDQDMAARIGGDEFAVLVREIDGSSELERARERVLAAFDEPVVIEAQRLAVQLSVGFAWFPSHGNTVDEVIDAADRSMYAQKERHAREQRPTQADRTLGA
ncbi:MAG: diguanylate cyclase domain-containing protein [Vulcanimicrobiaceae bacterium]